MILYDMILCKLQITSNIKFSNITVCTLHAQLLVIQLVTAIGNRCACGIILKSLAVRPIFSFLQMKQSSCHHIFFIKQNNILLDLFCHSLAMLLADVVVLHPVFVTIRFAFETCICSCFI